MEETKICPYCGEEIKAIAKKCRYCGEWLDLNAKADNPSSLENIKENTQPPSQLTEAPMIDSITHDLPPSESETETISEISDADTTQSSNIQETDGSLNTHVKKMYSIVIPAVAVTIFGIALTIFHFNYHYQDWWIDEDIIITYSITSFVVLLAIYYMIIYRIIKFGIKKNANKKKTSTYSVGKIHEIIKKHGKHIGIAFVALMFAVGGALFFANDKDRKTDSNPIYTERVNNVVNSENDVLVAYPNDDRYSVYYFKREYGSKYLYYYDAKTDTHKAYEFPDLATGGYISDAWVSPSKKYIILSAEDRYADFMRIDTETNKLEYIRSCGTIKKSYKGYTIVDSRCINEDEAEFEYEKEYVNTDYYYDEEGNYTGEHGEEYR